MRIVALRTTLHSPRGVAPVRQSRYGQANPVLAQPIAHFQPRASLTDRSAPLSRTSSLAFLLIVVVVAAVPFPYGAVTPSAKLLLCGAAFAIGALAFASKPARPQFGAAIIPIVAIIGISIAGGVQLIPMSIGRLRTLAPLAATTYSDANEILAAFGRPPVPARISIAPADTRMALLVTLAYVALFASAVILCSTRSRRRIVLGALLLSVIGQVIYASATTGAAQRLHGTFINPNSFAGYLEIALAIAFAAVYRELLYGRERAAGAEDAAERFERRVLPLLLPAVAWATVAAGLALTRSRGGIVAATGSTLVLIALVALKPRRDGSAATIATGAALFVIAGIIFVISTTGSAAALRFFASDPRDLTSNTRTEIWAASIKAWHSSPLLGSGLGAFRESFRRVQPASIQGLVEQAHNDFLQILVTCGVIGAALAAVALGSILILLVRAWLKQVRREESAVAIASIGALISLLLHGIVDFNLSIPAIPATLAVVLGTSWAAAATDTGGITRSRSAPTHL
jgi:O-antigen ligase